MSKTIKNIVKVIVLTAFIILASKGISPSYSFEYSWNGGKNKVSLTTDTKIGTRITIAKPMLNTNPSCGAIWQSANFFCIQYKTGIATNQIGTLYDCISINKTSAYSKRTNRTYNDWINQRLVNVLTADYDKITGGNISKNKFKRAKQIAIWRTICYDGLKTKWSKNLWGGSDFLEMRGYSGYDGLKTYVDKIIANNAYANTGTKTITMTKPQDGEGIEIKTANTSDEGLRNKYAYIVGPFKFHCDGGISIKSKSVNINGTDDNTADRFLSYKNGKITTDVSISTASGKTDSECYIALTKEEYRNANYTLKIKLDQKGEGIPGVNVWLFERSGHQNFLVYEQTTTSTSIPYTFTYNSNGFDTSRLIINKVDATTGEALSNAEFKIYNIGTDGNKNYIVADKENDALNSYKFVKYTDENSASVFVTNKQGQIIVENIKIDETISDSFVAEEVKAPEGYINPGNTAISLKNDKNNMKSVLKSIAKDTGYINKYSNDEFIKKTYQAILETDQNMATDYWNRLLTKEGYTQESAYNLFLDYTMPTVISRHDNYASIKEYLNNVYKVMSGTDNEAQYIDYYMSVMYNNTSIAESFGAVVKEIVKESGLEANCEKIADTELKTITVTENGQEVEKSVKKKDYDFVKALYRYIRPDIMEEEQYQSIAGGTSNNSTLQKVREERILEEILRTRGYYYLKHMHVAEDSEQENWSYDEVLERFIAFSVNTMSNLYRDETQIKEYFTNIYEKSSRVNASEAKEIDASKLDAWVKTVMDTKNGLTIKNSHATKIIISKVDADSPNEKLSGIGFKIKYLKSEKEQYYVSIDENGNAVYQYIDSLEEDDETVIEGSDVRTKEVGADPNILYTDDNGQIVIEGAYEGKYQITEVYIPEKYNGLYDGKKENINDNYGNNNIYDEIYTVTRDGNNEFKLTITNKKQTIDLSGFVWVDKYSSKKSIRNDYYKLSNNEYEDDKDELKAGVTVYLKDKNGNIVNNAEGNPCKATTNDNGEYKFEKVLRDKIADYHVEFEYDGLTYTNVTMNLTDKENVAKTSKAQESEADRNNFNLGFAEITGTENGDLTKGYAKDSNGTVKHNLTYKTDNHVATLSNIDGNINIVAKTQDSYIAERYKDMGENVSEITYINLGLYEREQPDITVMKDLQNVKLSINGYNHVYNYASRFNNAGEYGGEGFNVGVKFGSKYGNMTYTQSIYRSDYDYKNEKDTSKELKVNVTYKIAMKNESTNLVAQVNSLVDYFDSKYNLIAVGTELDNNGNVVGNKVNEAKYNSDYKKAVIETNTKIEPQKMESIYVQFELSKEATLNILNDKGNLDNVVEINSYSVFETNGKIYAGIDKDSAPGNCVPGNTDTYEDDTDKAPALLLEVQDGVARKLSGTVFEDNADETKLQAKYREGDGIYTEGNEHGIEGVKVKLISLTQDRSYEATTDSSGNFTIEGFIPDKYKVIYTWGGQTYQDTTYDVNNYKATIYNDAASSGENWWLNEEPRYSDAKDDYNLRTAIDNGTNTEGIMNSITAEINFGIHKGDTQITTNITTVDGDKFVIGEYETKNIDFGIIERPRQGLDMEKRVSHIKLTYANGTVAIDADVSKDGKIGVVDENGNIVKEETIKGMIYTPNQIKIEMDSELIQGSKLEVTYAIVVKNTSEYDYMNENFYTYGNYIGDTTNPVTISATGVNDYLDKEFAYDEKANSDWKIIREDSSTSKQEIVNTIPSTEWEQDGETITKPDGTKIIRYKKSLGGTETTTETTWKYTIQSAKQSELSDETIFKLKEEAKEQFKDIEPGQSKSVQLSTSKLLANSEEIELENKAEITQIDVKNGREPAIENTFDNAEDIIVIPPTGSNKDYILPIVLGTSLLAIIGVGVVLIKKKVLNK